MARRNQAPAPRSAPSSPAPASSGPAAGLPGQGWDKRLYPGLQLAAVAAEVRGPLVQALGEIGVEAEYLLGVLADFPGPQGPSPAAGDDFLARLEGYAQRLIPSASQLEIATQSYLTALEAGYPELRRAGEGAGARGEAEPWWPAFGGYAPPGEPIELRLRRCGYAYRHVVAVHLPATLEAIAEQMALVLHALGSLPPAGVLPARALAQGLYELSDAVEGDAVPHHILDVGPEFPGLFSAIQRLRALRATEDISLASDIAWARAQYEAAGGTAAPKRGLLARLLGRPAGRAAANPAGEWRDVIGALEALRAREGSRAGRKAASPR